MNFFKKIKLSFKEAKYENLYKTEGIAPVSSAIPFGLQHVLAMFIGNIAPVLIVYSTIGFNNFSNSAIQNSIFIAGIGTIIQLFGIGRIGGKLPLVIGMNFTFVGICISLSVSYGFGAMLGAVIIGGLITGVVGLFAKYWRKFIPSIVSAIVVLAVGLSLLDVGATYFAGINQDSLYTSSQAFLIGGITLVSYLAANIFLKGFWKNIAMLLALAIGYILSLCLGVVDFSALSTIEKVISLPEIVDLGIIEFNPLAIISATIVYLVTTTGFIGDTTALCNSAMNREPTDKEISGVISCNGFMGAISGLFGCLPLVTYAQNVAIVGTTKVVNRTPIFLGTIFLILAGLFPHLAGAVRTIPDCVFGGVIIPLFASICVVGIKMVGDCGFNARNNLILGLSLGIGFGFSLVSDSIFANAPELIQILGSNCVAMMFIVAMVLSLVLPKRMEKEI